MKHRVLPMIAHNFADWLACGMGFLVGMFSTQVFAEAAATPDGSLTFDVLSGKTRGAYPGGEVELAAPLYRNAFPTFCQRHGADHADFRQLVVTFTAEIAGNRFSVMVKDCRGRTSTIDYLGATSRRLRLPHPHGPAKPHIPFDRKAP